MMTSIELDIMLILLVVIIAMQNLMPMGITKFMGVDPLIGMAAGSISMTGGHPHLITRPQRIGRVNN